MKKKMLAVLLAAMFAGVILTACGSAPAEETKESEESAEESGESEEEPEPEEVVEEEKEPEILTIYVPVKKTTLMDGDSWISEEYEYDDHGNQIKNISYLSDGSIGRETETEFEYNDAGKMTQVTQYMIPESGKEKYVCNEYAYEYDEKGILIRSKETSYSLYEDMPEMNSTMVMKAEFNEQGDMIKWNSSIHSEDGSDDINDEYTYEYEYDAEGRVTKQTSYIDTEVRDIRIYEYDTEGRKAKEIYSLPGYWKDTREYEYDENGNRIKYTYDTVYEEGAQDWGLENESFTVETIYEYEYDNAGNVVKWTSYNKENPEQKIGECEYDANGNVIRQITYDSDGHSDGEEYEYIEIQIPDIKNYRMESRSIW